MRMIMMSVVAALAASACGSGNQAGSNTGQVREAGDNGAVAAVAVPDACTFFARAELESAIGSELREGEPQSVADQSESSCRFRKQLGSKAARTFPDPALPGSLGFDSVTVSTSSADPEAVAEIRKLDPAAFEDAPGVGDDAYFLGPALLHVRVGNRGFSLRINPDPQSLDDQAKVREVMLALAKTGASRL